MIQNRLQSQIGKIGLPTLLAYLLLLVALLTFGFIVVGVANNHKFWIDAQGFTIAESLQSAAANRFFLTTTFFGSSTFLLPANIILSLSALWVLRNKILALRLAVISFSAVTFMYILKSVFKRHRPVDFLIDQAAGYSFPSGHSLNSLVFFGLLLFFFKHAGAKKSYLFLLFFLFGLIVILIGFSRVYLRVHFASDVVAGFSLGIAWLLIALVFLPKRLQNKASKIS